MDRRAAAALVGTFVLGGCGGGGGGDAAAPSAATSTASPTAPSATPTIAAAASRNVAMWGDSLTPTVAANLQYLCPDRTIYDGGLNGETSTQIAARQLADTSRRDWINILWYGANNPTDPAQIKADLAASVASLPAAGRFLVLSVVNEALPESIRGGPVYASIVQVNADLANLYPSNYFDMRGFLVASYDPNNWQDVIDHQNDVVPASLRVDEIHFDNNGSLLVAGKLKALIESRGW